MPNVWTHILFSEKVVEKAGLTEYVKEVNPFLKLGSQGPDPFFYHNFWPWREKPVTEIGSKIHYEQCGPFLMKMINYGYIHKYQPKLLAYILGFVTHHLLDRHTHPYINYRSGTEGNRHQKLEIIIDTILMKKWRNIDTYKVPVYKELYVGQPLFEPINLMLSDLIKDIFPEEEKKLPVNFVKQSYTHMILALKVLHDPTGLKNKLLKERISPFSYQKHLEEKDYLNEFNTKWLHPTNNLEHSSDSFLTLFSNAEKEGIEILSLISDYWNTGDQEVYSLLEDKIGNISYDTGKDCTLNIENQYFDPIL